MVATNGSEWAMALPSSGKHQERGKALLLNSCACAGVPSAVRFCCAQQRLTVSHDARYSPRVESLSATPLAVMVRTGLQQNDCRLCSIGSGTVRE